MSTKTKAKVLLMPLVRSHKYNGRNYYVGSVKLFNPILGYRTEHLKSGPILRLSKQDAYHDSGIILRDIRLESMGVDFEVLN